MKSTIKFFGIVGILLLLFNLLLVPLFQDRIIGVSAQSKASIILNPNSKINLYKDGLVITEDPYTKGLVSGYDNEKGRLLWQHQINTEIELYLDENYLLLLKEGKEFSAINTKNGNNKWVTNITLGQ